MNKRYYNINKYFRNIYQCRVQKISIDAGFSCPNRDGSISRGGCIYCNIRGSGTGAYKKGQSITDQIEMAKGFLTRRYKAKKFLAYFQSYSNTYGPIEKLQRNYEEALNIDDIVGLSIGTRPDCVDENILDLLQSYTQKHLIWIEYGLQSSHDATLAIINRGHDFQCFKDAIKITKNRGIKICAHVILGLPGETKDHMITTAKRIAKIKIDGIKLHLLYVVKDTPLEKLYHQGDYKCLNQQDYVELVSDFLEHLPKEMVIHRLTGDPHPQELVAPKWSLKKNETLSMIDQILEKRDSWQGKLVRK